MSACIDNEDKLIDPSHSKQLLMALNRIKKEHNEIKEMGYVTYVEAEGFYNVLNGEPHSRFGDTQQENIVASVDLKGIDMGAW